MNIQNISALTETLQLLGFSSVSGKELLRYACLRQSHFYVHERHTHGNDVINYQIFFSKDQSSDNLICTHYDAVLRKEIEAKNVIVNGIDVQNLDSRMTSVDWLPENSGKNDNEIFSIMDKNTWRQEAAIEEIMQDMETLSITEEGRLWANMLKYKHWIELPLQNMIPNLITMKSRFESAQRFYIVDGEGITAGEAYRFLNNRWRDKQIQANKRKDQHESERMQDKPEVKTTRGKKKREKVKG